MPRNVAVFHATLSRIADGSEVKLEQLSAEGLMRPEEPLATGTAISATFEVHTQERSQTAITTDVIDTEPPSTPVLASARWNFGECCCAQGLDFSVLASDDHTADEELLYLIYQGETPEEAMTVNQPITSVRPSGAAAECVGPWVAVTAVDMAGNESPRSEAVRSTMSSGCSAARVSSAAPTTLVALALWLTWAACRRDVLYQD